MPCSRLVALVLAAALTLAALPARADDNEENPPEMSLEDLLGVEVTSASRKTEHQHEVAAAVYVITREEIASSGATNIPQALRLAPGVEVASLANNRWAVSVRGFNSRFGNKLLVLMDGRSIYSPLFSGVLWEYEDTLLEDIDRIEVIRGPGAAMWGANAVNGVINIITRHSRDTQGTQLIVGAGSEDRLLASARYGRQSRDGHYRVWGKAFVRDESTDAAGHSGNDYWRSARVGFRGDWKLAADHRLMLSGQAYMAPTGDAWTFSGLASPQPFALDKRRQDGRGAHLLGRSEWSFANGSEAALQAYVDYATVDLEDAFRERRTTADIDFQHRLPIDEYHDLIWGLGYRYSSDSIDSSGIIEITPRKRSFNLASAFIYDDITLLPNTLRLMLGLRLENSSFAGFEPLPNARLLWTPTPTQTLWGSVSRAVRIPSRAEFDAQVDIAALPPGAPGNPTPLPLVTRNIPAADLKPETVIAWDFGFRQRFSPALSLDISAFYNEYDDLRSASLGNRQLVLTPRPAIMQTVFPDNSVKARTRGFEVALDWYPLRWWRVQPSFSVQRLTTSTTNDDPASQATADLIKDSSPQKQAAVRSSMSLSNRQQFDLWLRYVGSLGTGTTAIAVPSYTTLDLRYAWRPTRDFELSIVGQNLLDHSHPEFIPSLLPSQTIEIQRGGYVKAKWLF